jgi:hypothetical protein
VWWDGGARVGTNLMTPMRMNFRSLKRRFQRALFPLLAGHGNRHNELRRRAKKSI